MIQQPIITGYRLEVVEVPAAKDEDRIDREALGIDPPTPPPGPPTRMLRITLEGDGFPVAERRFDIRIGDQLLAGVEILGHGTGARGFLQRPPRAGEEIALHVDTPGQAERQVLVAEAFDPSKLDDATA